MFTVIKLLVCSRFDCHFSVLSFPQYFPHCELRCSNLYRAEWVSVLIFISIFAFALNCSVLADV